MLRPEQIPHMAENTGLIAKKRIKHIAIPLVPAKTTVSQGQPIIRRTAVIIQNIKRFTKSISLWLICFCNTMITQRNVKINNKNSTHRKGECCKILNNSNYLLEFSVYRLYRVISLKIVYIVGVCFAKLNIVAKSLCCFMKFCTNEYYSLVCNTS